ncbi:MAG: lipid-A-disaccharide synthase [Desulfovibrionaceae bacterium]
MSEAPHDTIWISAGEASGDMHGARLARELVARRPGLRCVGMGGPAMAAAGVDLRQDMEAISGVGFTEVLALVPRALRILAETRRALAELRPRAVVVIDCPEFNFRLAKAAHGLGIPVYYYVCPQIWAWRRGRTRLLERYFREALCVFPFEQAFYEGRGVAARYVGNPLLDELPLDELDAMAPDPERVGLLPGSRRKEIAQLMPEFAGAARRVAEARPGVKFTLFPAPNVDPARLLAHWPAGLDVTLADPARRYQAMRSCGLLLLASGTVALEAALAGTPALVAYRLSALTYRLTRLVVRVRFASLPNLILDREIFPERFQAEATAEPLARAVLDWLTHPEKPAAVRAELARLRQVMGGPGAAGRAAELILEDARA